MKTSPRILAIVASAICAVVALGAAIASNVAFKLPYTLTGPAASGGQGTGKNLVSLPYRPKSLVTNAHQLMLDIGGGIITPVLNIAKFNAVNNTLITYTGRMGAGAPFALTAGEGYLVQMNANVNYTFVGAHDAGIAVQLNGPGALSMNGLNWFAVPYNSTATTALDLMKDIGGGSITSVNSVARYNRSNDTLTTYTGRMGAGAPFVLTAGEAYIVQMNSTVPYVPSHY